MTPKETLEDIVGRENFNQYRPVERDSLLLTHLALLICKELTDLRLTIESLKDSINPVATGSSPNPPQPRPYKKKSDSESKE